MNIKNAVSQNIFIFPKINKKKGFAKHSIVGRGWFSTNDSISEGLHWSYQPVALLRHYWAFSSSVLLDRLFLIFLLKIFHELHMGFRSGMLAGQSSTVISWSANHLEVVLTLWAGAKILLEKEISISIKQHLQKSRCINRLYFTLLLVI